MTGKGLHRLSVDVSFSASVFSPWLVESKGAEQCVRSPDSALFLHWGLTVSFLSFSSLFKKSHWFSCDPWPWVLVPRPFVPSHSRPAAAWTSRALLLPGGPPGICSPQLHLSCRAPFPKEFHPQWLFPPGRCFSTGVCYLFQLSPKHCSILSMKEEFRFSISIIPTLSLSAIIAVVREQAPGRQRRCIIYGSI